MNTSRLVPLACAVLLLAACDTAEERAEKHFQSAVELLETGDVQRAMVEFRNALALDASHREARLMFARQSRESGNIAESYQNYLRLSEHFPDDAEARLNLAEIAILNFSWDDAERHGTALIEANADIEGRDVIELALAFRAAILEKDTEAQAKITRQAEALFETHPDNQILHRILIEGYTNEGRFEDAIALTERALEADARNKVFYEVKTSLLAQLGDVNGLEEHLEDFVKAFPEDTEAKLQFLRMLVGKSEIDRAETFLRDDIIRADDKVGAHISLITFIREFRGQDAALLETERAIEAYENDRLLTALKAGIMFESGERDEAIVLMEGVIEAGEPSDETDRLKVALARMLVDTGNEVGARQLVEQVLEHDPNQVEALKMSAVWLIDADQADQAITVLRQALDQEPEDAETMTLMARAHERNGNRQLAQDLLSLAAEASNFAPEESLRLADIQMRQQRYSAAEDTLVKSLRSAPGNMDILSLLGRVYVAREDWSRAEQVERTLRGEGSEPAIRAADEIRLRLVAQREGNESGIEFLEELAEEREDVGPRIALIRARLSEGKQDEALALAQELVADAPDNAQAKFVLGATQMAARNFANAEATFRGILATDDNSAAAMQLIRAVGAQPDKADQVPGLVDEMLGRMPESIDLLWAKASLLESDQNIEGAIDIYEQLYAQNSDSPVIANNLASLLATYRTDDASLERAAVVARRLRNTEVAPFQDTYGWILFRQGKVEEAVEYLEPAAAQLATDPIVSYHLGRAYAALGRNDDALQAFERAVELAGLEDERAQIQTARAEIERLSSEGQ